MMCCMFGGPPEITYLGSGPGPFSIGPARADRIIASFMQYESDAGNQFSSCTIGGVAATMAANGLTSDPFGFAWAVVPSGTTASVTPNIGVAYATYMITGLANNAVFSENYTSTGGSVCSQTINTPVGFSAILGGARSRNSNSAYTVASNVFPMTTDFSANFGGGGNPSACAGHGIADINTSTNITESASTFVGGLGYAVCFY